MSEDTSRHIQKEIASNATQYDTTASRVTKAYLLHLINRILLHFLSGCLKTILFNLKFNI
jgi:hypothetical protein